VDVKSLYQRAHAYYASGKFEDAEGVFRLLTTIAPAQSDFWFALGATFQLQRKFKDAIDSFGAAALLDKKELNPFPHAHAADCFWAMDEKENATIALKSALAIAKKDSKHHAFVEKLQLLHNRWTNG
jgi:type III secretion system low calcium response chaperone LcrH/SycD